METETIIELITTLIPLIVGPGGAIVLCVLLLAFVGYITVKHIIPSIEKRFDQSQENINILMVEHREDRVAFKEAITSIGNKMDRLGTKVKDLSGSVDELKNKIENRI